MGKIKDFMSASVVEVKKSRKTCHNDWGPVGKCLATKAFWYYFY